MKDELSQGIVNSFIEAADKMDAEGYHESADAARRQAKEAQTTFEAIEAKFPNEFSNKDPKE